MDVRVRGIFIKIYALAHCNASDMAGVVPYMMHHIVPVVFVQRAYASLSPSPPPRQGHIAKVALSNPSIVAKPYW